MGGGHRRSWASATSEALTDFVSCLLAFGEPLSFRKANNSYRPSPFILQARGRNKRDGRVDHTELATLATLNYFTTGFKVR